MKKVRTTRGILRTLKQENGVAINNKSIQTTTLHDVTDAEQIDRYSPGLKTYGLKTHV